MNQSCSLCLTWVNSIGLKVEDHNVDGLYCEIFLSFIIISLMDKI